MKILVIRFSSLGDILLCSPVVRCIKEQLNAEVHFLTKASGAVMLKGNPHIDKICLLEDSLHNTIKTLRKNRYDFIVDLHNNLRSRAIGFSLFSVSQSHYPKYTAKRYQAIHFHKLNVLPTSHVTDRYFETVKKIGVKNDGQGLEYFFFEPVSLPFDSYIAIAIGSKHATKQIPLNKMKALCKLLKLPVILLGDENDRKKGALLERDIQQNGNGQVYNACGKWSFGETAFVVKSAQFIISGDSVLMHLAAALDKNLVSVWGSTVPEFGMYPLFKEKSMAHHLLFENKGLPCRPCHKHGYSECPKKHFSCMQSLDVEKMAASINSLINV